MKMEIDTLCNYEQRSKKDRIDNKMDINHTDNDDGGNSPVVDSRKDSPEPKEASNNEAKETDTSAVIESESDEDCEEEEEKLLLSPAHSEDGGEPLSPVNRDLLDSDCEGEREDSDRLDKDIDNDGSETKKADDSGSETKKAVVSESITDKDVNDEENEPDESKKDEDNTSEVVESGTVDTEENCDSDKKDEEENSKDGEMENAISGDSENPKDNVDVTEDNDEKEESDDKDKHKSETKEPEEKMDTQEDIVEAADDKKMETNDEENKEDVNKESIESTDEEEKVENNENEDIDNSVKGIDEDKKKDNEDKENTDKKESTEDEESNEGKKENNEIKESNAEKENNGDKKEINDDKKETVEDGNVKENDNEVTKIVEEDSKEVKDDTKSKEAEKNDIENEESATETSLLKETLMKPPEDFRPDGLDDDIDMDDDFDPSLLMPELSMEVEEAPVITNTDAPPPEQDGSKSPLRLYDPIFSTFVDEMTGAEVDFDLTTEELELKAKTFGEKNPVQFTKIHCTACNIHLGSALDGQGNRFVHPLLKVLICKKCYHFYTSGEFEKDEDGSELYCRWCGQGGQVMCCANCEMVFCKKCIRINFDRRKLAEIQRSDDWTCFKCNPAQLINLRIHCAEFMEYVQKEIRNASNAENPEKFMNTDHCQCCIPQKKKATETTTPVSTTRKRKRHVEQEDPDYNPLKDRESPTPLAPSAQPTQGQQKMPTLTPKPQIVLNASVASKPPTLRPMTSPQIRSRMPVTTIAAVRPQAGYIRIAPGSVRSAAPVTPVVSPARPPALRPIRPVNTVKHEWFEKTVRAAARVNSNLSYTLTQLNRAQANATSVEALAVVHNKLQEILSSSINSLIQIRKNLRTEFIAGIKNIRFPPKQSTTNASSSSPSKDDDDVIFIPDAPSPTPPATTAATVVTTPSLPPGLSLIKKCQASTSRSSSPSITSVAGPSGVTKMTTSTPPKPSTSTGVQPKGFLRVKSFSALQNVTSECITIPDDPVEDPDVVPVIETDPLEMVEVPEEKPKEVITEKDIKEEIAVEDITTETKRRTNGMTNGNKDDEAPSSKTSEGVASPASMDSDLERPTTMDDDLERPTKKAKIVIERSSELDKLARITYGIVNGNSDESEKEVDK